MAQLKIMILKGHGIPAAWNPDQAKLVSRQNGAGLKRRRCTKRIISSVARFPASINARINEKMLKSM